MAAWVSGVMNSAPVSDAGRPGPSWACPAHPRAHAAPPAAPRRRKLRRDSGGLMWLIVLPPCRVRARIDPAAPSRWAVERRSGRVFEARRSHENTDLYSWLRRASSPSLLDPTYTPTAADRGRSGRVFARSDADRLHAG